MSACRWLLPMLLICSLARAADPFAHPVTGEELMKGALSAPAAKLARAEVLTGTFTHQKHLREIPKPLTSSGEFTFARSLGVYWHTRKPFDSVVVLTPSGILEQAEGSRSLKLSADEQPAVRMIASVFLALFTLDVSTLERSFELSAVSEGTRWTLGLKPRGGAIAQVFQRATVSGGADVEQVVLTDARGDRTVIDLAAIEYSSAPPDAQTRSRFTPAKP